MTVDESAASSVRCNSLSVKFSTGHGRTEKTVTAVDDVSFDLPAGQITSLIGPSGCGKTTLLRAIAGLQAPAAGNVDLHPTSQPGQGELAFVFQQPALLPWRTAIENVTLPLRLTGQTDPRHHSALAAEILHTVGLGEALNHLPHQLSGGMQMRVSIARALVTSPRVLLLDEPFASLDDMLRGQLGDLLLRLWSSRHFTAVMVTHNIAEAVLLSHQVLVMQDGCCSQPISNPLSFPRSQELRRTAAFGEFYGLVSDQLTGKTSADRNLTDQAQTHGLGTGGIR